MADIRLGLIGAGRWGRNFFRTIEDIPQIKLTRVASRNPEIGNLLLPDCKIHSDWRLVAQADDLDGVIIATPPGLHASMAATAIEAGLAVFVEKPLTLDVAQAEMLVETIDRYDGHMLVDHTQLFNPAFIALKRAVSLLGSISSVHSIAGNWGPFRTDVSVLWDWGPHDVAMCLDLLGRIPNEIGARRVGIKNGYEESIELLMDFGDGVNAIINLSNKMPEKTRKLEIICDYGVLFFDDFAKKKVSYSYRGDVAQHGAIDSAIQYSSELPLTAALRYFVETIRGNNSRCDYLKSSIDVVRTLARCQRSLEA